MRAVDVDELKENTRQILRRVQDERADIAITQHGRVIARLIPADSQASDDGLAAAAWDNLDLVAAEIGARWPAGINAVEAVREVRREL